MGKTCCWVNPKPDLSIQATGSTKLGRCYYEGRYKIVSYCKLTSDQIQALWKAGFLGAGQQFGIKSQCDGKEAAAGYDVVEGHMRDDNGNRLDDPPTHGPTNFYYYEYETYYRCDSGD
jgi:hypothetical protein